MSIDRDGLGDLNAEYREARAAIERLERQGAVMNQQDLPVVPLDDYAEIVAEYREAREAVSRWKKLRDETAADIKKVLGDRHAVGTLDGKIVVTYSSHERPSLDADWLKLWYPDIYHQALRVTPVSTLRVN